jgi:basic membrane protein A
VRDNVGRVAIAMGALLNDEQILKMNWLAEGVQGRVAR